jgi:hypothetical protein
MRPEQRLEWAQGHLQRLRAAVTTYLRGVRLSEDDHIGAIGSSVTALWVTVDVEPPPQIGLIAGDAVHNLRSALDNVMWELAPPAVRARNPNRTAFPIKETAQAFASTRNGVLAGFGQTPVDEIGKLQPFLAHEDGGLPAGGGQLLALLDTFWNDDKHRVPMVGVTVAGGTVPTHFHGSTAYWRRQPMVAPY